MKCVILFILIGVVLLFVGCITLLLYTKEDNVSENSKSFTNDMGIIFECENDSSNNKFIDDELI